MTYTPFLFAITVTHFSAVMALVSLLIPYLPGPGQTLGIHSFHGIIHSFIFLLLRSITVPTDQMSTAQPMHPTHITLMSLNLALKAFPNSLSDASILIPIHFWMTSNMKLGKHPSILLEHGCQVYLPGYDVVHMLGIAMKGTKRLKGWKAFQCVQGRVVVAEGMVRSRRSVLDCVESLSSHSIYSNSFLYLHSLWTVILSLITSYSVITFFASDSLSFSCHLASSVVSFFLRENSVLWKRSVEFIFLLSDFSHHSQIVTNSQ